MRVVLTLAGLGLGSLAIMLSLVLDVDLVPVYSEMDRQALTDLIERVTQ